MKVRHKHLYRDIVANLRYWAEATLWLAPCVALVAGLLGYFA